MYKSYESLLIDVADGIAVITMNRPSAMNAITDGMNAELRSIWRDLDNDPAVRVSVLIGSGDRAFSAGGDMKEAAAKFQREGTDYFDMVVGELRAADELVYNLIHARKPVISAINGVAVGAGLAVALLADISIMADDARLIDGHAPLGLTAGDHSSMIWPLLCGMAKSKYYLLTSEAISAKDADALGLVSKVVPQSDLMTEAMAVARKVADYSQFAMETTKRALNQWLRLGGLASFDYSLATEMLCYFDGRGEAARAAAKTAEAAS
jgi:enoyl-CoA hydratase